MDYDYVYHVLVSDLQNYLRTSKLQSLVIGESGGIDSALVTVLASAACKAENIPLIARYIHIETNKPDEKERATMAGKEFADDFKSVDLTSLYKTLFMTIEENHNPLTTLDYRIRLGNMKARMRMIYLYNLAQKHRGLVLSTDNWTEYLLGFWTLHGDVGDYAPIQMLWKTEVYELSKYCIENVLKRKEEKIALQLCIDAVPTDGLGTTSSDLEQLEAASYQEVDQLLIRYTENNERSTDLLEHPVIKRHLQSSYKRKLPICVPRKLYEVKQK